MRFMVGFKTLPGPEEELTALITAERARVQVLREQGVIEELYLASDLARGWLVMQCESLEQVQQYLQTLPLYAYLEMEINQIR